VSIWLGLAVLFALLLLANSVRDYFFVARILTVQQVRHRLAQQTASFEHELVEQPVSDQRLLDSLAVEMAGATKQAIWVVLRDPDGKIIGQAGAQERQLFTHDQEVAHFRRREPLFDLVQTSRGEAVVEVFPLFVRRNTSGADQAHIDAQAPYVVAAEIAMPLTIGNASLLWPIRRNLLINTAAAFALLLTVSLTALGFRWYVRGKELEQQLELARQVQANLLPKSAQLTGLTDVAVEYKPVDEVAGDFYDLFQTDGGLALVVGDVSGKGVPAALLMGVIHGAVRATKWWQSAADHAGESAALNRLLYERASDDRFATMFWSYFDSETRILRYVNAGHCPPFLVGVRDGKPEVRRLDVGGPVLGALDDAAYVQGQAETGAGDLIFLYSDGLVEAQNANGEEFGESRLIALLKEAVHESPEKILGLVLLSVRRFLGDTPAQDDLTCVVARLGTTVTQTRGSSENAPGTNDTAGTTTSTDALSVSVERA
jgi:sigma-B regulation protein RsbU (phosphoserine phosphatase)